jgi:hypothetical protein
VSPIRCAASLSTLNGGQDVSAWYLLSGSIRLRRCPEVEAIIAELGELKGDEFEAVVAGAGPGVIEFTYRGGSEFTDDGADELDALLRSLGPHAVGPAVFAGEYDGEPRSVAVDRAAEPVPVPGGLPIRGIVR